MELTQQQIAFREARRLARKNGTALPVATPAVAPATRAPAKLAPAKLVGEELSRIIHERYGVKACGGCEATARKMNANGAAWCREHVDELIEEMRTNSKSKLLTALAAKLGEAFHLFDYRVLIIEACDACEPQLPPGAIVYNADRHGFGDAMNVAAIGDPRIVIKASGSKAELMNLFGQTVITQHDGAFTDYSHTYNREKAMKGRFARVDIRAKAMGASGVPALPRYIGGGESSRRWAELQPPNTVMLFPECENSSRRWPLNYWCDLFAMLAKDGLSPAFFVPQSPSTELAKLTCHVGLPWENICELLQRCRFGIGSDSGPAHVAGTLGVPFLCLVGPTIHGGGFEYTPSVEFISVTSADVPCVGCYWTGENYRSSCNLGCEAMMRLRPSIVFEKARAIYAANVAVV